MTEARESPASLTPLHEVEFALPAGRLVWRAIASAVVVSGVGCGISLALGEPPMGALMGGVALLGMAVGPLVIRPWQPRAVAKWGAHLLAAQVISLMCVTLFGVLLYFATQPSALALAAVVATGFILAQTLQIAVFKRAIVDIEQGRSDSAQG